VFRLYDTRYRQVADIVPARRRELRMYACGPAACPLGHIGNLRTGLLSDLIRRTADRHDLVVSSGQNISGAGSPAPGAGSGPAAQDAFRTDCSALNIHPPDYPPRGSESAGLTIELIGALIESGHAYVSDGGSAYFDARTFPGYGEISRRRPDADWALWTGTAAGDPAEPAPTWAAPWGQGFPAEATECSAVSLHYLGETIDIHVGDIGQCFPHHENERAQSDSVAGHEVIRHWVHGAHLLFEGREMTGSAGNVVLLADLTERGLDPLALRLALLEHRYRQQPDLTWPALTEADQALRRWREQVAEWATHPSKPLNTRYAGEVADAFDDDLDTPAAVRALRALAADAEVPPGAKFETFAHIDRQLGLDLARDIGRAPARPPLPPAAQQQTAGQDD
jgi:cysteinyl-tRNA synthetase